MPKFFSSKLRVYLKCISSDNIYFVFLNSNNDEHNGEMLQHSANKIKDPGNFEGGQMHRSGTGFNRLGERERERDGEGERKMTWWTVRQSFLFNTITKAKNNSRIIIYYSYESSFRTNNGE